MARAPRWESVSPTSDSPRSRRRRRRQALRGAPPDDATIKRAAQLAADAAQPAADLRGSVEYKKDLVRVLTVRALRKALARAGGRR